MKPTDKQTAADLYGKFTKETGSKITATAFGKALGNMEVPKKHDSTGSVYWGFASVS